MIGAEFSPVNENKKSWFCISKIEFHDTKQYVPKEFSHIFSTTEQTHQAEKIKNRRKNEVVRPFEPSSTVVHPCTTVEGEGFFGGEKNPSVVFHSHPWQFWSNSLNFSAGLFKHRLMCLP